MNAGRKYVFMLIFFALISSCAFSATITTTGSGNWNSVIPGAPWPLGIAPLPGDDVVIKDGTTLTVDGDKTIRSIGFGVQGPSATAGLVVNAGFTLTVTTDILCPIGSVDTKISAVYTLSGAGTINCANLVTNNALKPSGSNTTSVTVVSTVNTINISNNLLINATVNQGNKTNNGVFNLRSGTVNVGNAVTTVSVANTNTATLDMTTSAAGPTLNLSNPDPWDLSNKGINVTSLNGTGTTVNYNGTGTQNFVLGTTYNNLTLSGTGNKKIQAGVTVAGTLSMQGTAAATNNSPTYLASATLEYKGSTAQTTTDIEYPLTAGPQNVRVDNPLGVTLNDNKSVPGTLTFVNGKLVTGINKVSIGVAGSVVGAGPGKYIYGNEEIFVANTLNPTETFHIGDANTYAPATVTFSGTTTGSGSLTASTSAGDNADIDNSGINSASSVNRNWTISRNGITGFASYDATFNYAASDIDPGADPATFVIRKLSGTWGTANTMATNALSTQAGGMTSFGTYQIGKANTIAIDTDPVSHPACIGSGTTFSSTSSVIPTPSVKWQRADLTGIFTDISSAMDGGVYTNFTSTTLVISNVTAGLNNYRYRAIHTNINGAATSAEATLTTTIPPSATISYSGSPYCTTLTTDQVVNQTGTTGGTYSSATGLAIDGVTGNITPSISSPGTYTVTYTIAASGGCPTYTATTTITITAAPSASIYYAGNPFCTTVTTAQPVTRTGSAGGTFSSTAALVMNTSTGAITPSASTPGTYTVTYTVPAANGCAQYSTTTTVTVTQAPTATIAYAGSPFCTSNAAMQSVTRTGNTTGIFSAAAGLSIDPTNGVIIPSESTPGTYTVTYTIGAYAGCAAYSTTTSVTITAMPSATISHAGSPFCNTITTAQPVTRAGTAGGTYSAGTGLSIDPVTGAITPSTSAPGAYTVTYTIAAGGCASFTTTASVTITSASATIFYQESPFCSSEPTPQTVTLTGRTGGTFSSTAGLTIDATTGEIIPASSTPGTYTVTYTVSATGGCGAFTATTSITVTPAPYALISYTAPAFCTTVNTNQAVTRTGNASGSYSSAPGLSISATTGAIKPSTSTAGTYTVLYTVAASGGCAAFFASTTVTITDPPSATISYAGPFCTTVSTAQSVTRTGSAGGTYSSVAGLSIDATTGAITPSVSTPGTYTVTYFIAASGGCTAFSTTTPVTITQAPSATISYAGTPFCTSITTAQAVTRTGTSGGTYSSTAGLTINASTGAITPSTSTAATYTVTYTIAASASCAVFTTTTSVTITAAPSATISYTGAPFCTTVTTAQAVTRTGTAGGTFSSTTGLSINAATGAITPSASTPGTYTVTYTIAATGGCAAFSATTSVTITQAPSATISYAGTPFCTSVAGSQAVTRTGTSGGTYGSTAGLTINAGSGAITPSTSTAGTYTVTYTITASGGCAAFTTTTSVTITTAPSSTISYAGAPFCTSVTTAQPVTLTGTTGGTYSSTAGLSINAATGAITPSTSTPGTYTVTYAIAASAGCAAFSTTKSVTITQAPSATISYTGTPFCTSVTTAQGVTRTGTAGGTYSSTAGLSINAATGSITPSASSPGTYTVTYTIAASGGCAAFTATTTISITIGSAATITYAGAPFCTTVTTAQAVTRTGTLGGTFSSTAGLSISASTGAITPSASTPGTYTVSYAVPTSGGCGTYNATTSVTITAAPAATISYATPFCKTITTAQAVTRTGTAGGTFSSTAGLTISASTGAITPSSSTAGTYTVTLTIAASGGCAAISTTTSVTITTAPSASISYAASAFCTTVATAQAVTRTGTAGGTFSSSAGLSINASTGAITPSLSTPGSYTVTYTVAASGGCVVYTTTTSVTITSSPSATISYAGTSLCTSVTAAQAVTLTGTAGGTFSSTAGLSISASTGAITPSASTAGTYTVTYSIAASGGCAAFNTTTSVTITAAPSATISYASSVFCTITATAQPVTRTGTAGGAYSSSAALTLNAATGAITPSTSIPGTYTVTYTIAASGACAAFSTTTTVTISVAPSASISYSGSPFCTSVSGTIPVIQTGATGGTYSSGAGLSINASTGAITPSASTAGTYTVTYTIAASGGCSAFTTTTSVTIAGGSATISYATNPFCTSVTTAQAVTRTGTTGGTYSAASGLILNTSTGQITPSTSTPGTYTVSYTLPAAGGCPAFTATTTVTITKAPTATISYAGTPFCTSEGDQLVTQTGTAGGVYSAASALSINSTTGAINPSLSTAGTYTVTYTIASAGGCAAFSTTASITITQAKTATISYAGNPFCESDNTSASVTLTGTTGGAFSASPSGLSMDASGTVKLNKSVRGDYTVTYTIAATGGCSAFTATTPLNIDQPAVMSISYPGTELCTLTTTPQPVFQTGVPGGTYSATGLVVDPSSGDITPYPSPAGTYTVSYKVTNGCGNYTATTPVTIKANPSATISYAGNPYCGAITTLQPVTRTGTTGGTYSSTTGLTIDATTGAISPFESSAGTYTVTYTVSNGGCIYEATTSVTIYSISLVSIAYDATSFCKSLNNEQWVTQIGGSGGGTFSAPAGLAIDATTGSIIPSASTAGTYTVSYAVPESGSCPSYAATTSVTITDIPNATMLYTGSPYCSNGDTASVSLSGTAGGTFSSSAGLSLNAATGNITLGTSTVGMYTVNYDIPAIGGCGSFSTSAPVAIEIHAIWNGSVSRNWHNPNNWSCGGVPTLTSDALIPAGLSNYPIIYSGIGTTRNLTIETGASIIDSGALTIAGRIDNSGVIDAVEGKVELAWNAAQNINTSLFYSKTIRDLVISNPAGVSLTGPLRVTGLVGFGNVNNSVFTTGDSLTLASVPTSDACIRDVTNAGVNFGNIINGFVTVERYMPPKRAYRFLTAPVNSTGSIKANWMENSINPDRWNRVNPFPGYGTNITGAGDIANGFDPTQTHNASMFTFNNQTQIWSPIPNTNGLMSAGNAYRIIVRGDRDIDMNTNTPTPTPTTLRATGSVLLGNVNIVKAGASGGMPYLSANTWAYNLVANPYPSAVNWLTVDKTDLAGSIYFFDPTITGSNGRGAYVSYNCTMGINSNGSSYADNYIQSGQSFFVQTTGPNPSIRFKETDKAGLHRSVFRTFNDNPYLSVQLLLPSQEGTPDAADGLKVFFADDFTNAIGQEDSYKFSNQDENLGIMRNGNVLSIEGRKPIVESDTIPLKIWQLTQKNYILKVNFEKFADNVEAYLEDKYLHLTSPLSTYGETKIPVNITSDAASLASDRFKIIFQAYATLPLHLLGIKAVEKNNGVEVGWSAESESNMDRYEVEKSPDGQQFVTAGTVKAKTNPGPSSFYSWFDLIPFEGDNYYRIKSVDKSGDIKYSSITKVRITKGMTAITVFPNPVHGKIITLAFSNIKKGNYSVRLMNSLGEKVYDGTILHNRGSSNHSIELNKVLPTGVYQLLISNGVDIEKISVLVQ